MASNDITGSGTVLYQADDDLSESNLADVLAKGNQTDYVERGLGVTYDSAADTIDIGAGHAVIEDGNAAYDLFPDAETDISLPNTGGNNYVYLVHDPASQDDVRYHVDDDDSAPADPSLRIAVVDANADNVSEKRRAPRAEYEAIDVEEIATELGAPSDVTGSRSLGATYQNSNDYDIFVIANLTVSTSGDSMFAELRVGQSNTLKTGDRVDRYALEDIDTRVDYAVTGRVPAGYYYEVPDFGIDNSSIDKWHERGLRV